MFAQESVMDIKKEREAFVENYRKVYKVDKSLFVNDSGEFTDLFCQDAWVMWQAAKAQAVPEWISVEDGLPSDGQDIIAFDAIKHCVFKDGEFLQGYFEPDTGHEYTEPVDVTHWIAIEAQEPVND